MGADVEHRDEECERLLWLAPFLSRRLISLFARAALLDGASALEAPGARCTATDRGLPGPFVACQGWEHGTHAGGNERSQEHGRAFDRRRRRPRRHGHPRVRPGSERPSHPQSDPVGNPAAGRLRSCMRRQLATRHRSSSSSPEAPPWTPRTSTGKDRGWHATGILRGVGATFVIRPRPRSMGATRRPRNGRAQSDPVGYHASGGLRSLLRRCMATRVQSMCSSPAAPPSMPRTTTGKPVC